MREVTTSELRRNSGEVLDRVAAGARLVVTRSGRSIAELVPLRRPPTDVATLLERWSQLPMMDPSALRGDVDTIFDPTT